MGGEGNAESPLERQRLSRVSDHRLARDVLGKDGRVLADSQIASTSLSDLEPHHLRPEVIAAQQDGYGRATRYSTTVGRDLLYVAVPFGEKTQRGTVRVAMSLHEVEEIQSRLWTMLALAGVIGLFIAALLSAIASHLIGRAIRRVALCASP